jgi:hypothetical protein
MFTGGLLPDQPSALIATAVSDSEIDLTWTDNSTDETGFEVWRATDGGTIYTLHDTTAPNITSYADTGLTSLHVYHYKVRASRAGAASAYTEPYSTTTWVTGPLYVSFKIKFGADEIADGFGTFVAELTDLPDLRITLYYSSGLSSWVYAIGGSGGLYAGSIVADTYVTVDLKVEWSESGMVLTPRFDGTAGDPVTNGALTKPPTNLSLGAIQTEGGLNNRTYDDVTFGNTDWGSTEFLSADFASDIVPPFLVIEGATVELDSGAMHVHNAGGTEAFAYFITFGVTD